MDVIDLEDILAEARKASLTRDNPALADLPDWVSNYRDHQRVAIREILTAFEEGVDCVVLDAPTGCLSGDTIITVNRGGNAKQVPLFRLVHSFNGGELVGRNGTRKWDLSIPTRISCADEGYMRLGVLGKAYKSGIKVTYRASTPTYSLRATLDHKFLTPNGFVCLGDIQVGDLVAVVGDQRKGNYQSKKCYRYVNAMYRHPHATNRCTYEKCEGWRVPLHRLTMEAIVNNVSLDQWVSWGKEGYPSTVQFLDPAVVAVHHKNGNSMDNNPTNLEILPHLEHWAQEGREKTWKNVAYPIVFERLTGLEYYGEEETYDLGMAEEPHNFIANGYAVHNSGKTLIGETVRRLLSSQGALRQTSYICSSKALQAQFLKDYPYAKVIQGRSNYATERYPERFGGRDGLSAADCTKTPGDSESCLWCVSTHSCPYERAKSDALRSSLAVLNTSYFLSECNGPGRFSRGGLVIADECLAAGTQISTPNGLRTIEDIKVGDVIWGEKGGKVVRTTVEATSINKASVMALNGLSITGNHPILTDRGYVEASQISPLDRIAVTGLNPSHGTTLRMVPTALPGEEPAVFQRKAAKVLQSSLLRGVEEDVTEGSTSRDLRVLWDGICEHEEDSEVLQSTLCEPMELASEPQEDGWGAGEVCGIQEHSGGQSQTARVAAESQQSDLRPCSQAKSLKDAISPGIQSSEWRQWYRTNGAAEALGRSVRRGMGNGVGGEDRETTPTLLQDRYCKLDDRVGYRGGRGESSESQSSRSGRQKDSVSGESGLDNSSSSQQEGYGELGKGSSQNQSCRVHNLRTTTHNYIAEGIVVHNCDSLEGELMSHVEVRISERRLKAYGLSTPKYVTKEESWREWAEDAYEKVYRKPPRGHDPQDIVGIRAAKRHGILVGKLNGLRKGLASGNWVYTGDRATAAFKPVTVDGVGQDKLWRHGDKWLLMSATVISADELVESLGLPEDKDFRLVKCPSTFKPENRKVIVWPVVSMTYKTRDESWPEVTKAVASIALEENASATPSGKILVHSSSYALTEHIVKGLMAAKLGRPTFSYMSADTREATFNRWQQSVNGIMVAPSLDRGIDLPGDACRTQIIVKVPFLSIKDKQVSGRLYGTGRAGKVWYAVNAIRTIIQMCGRACRSEDDWCETWILDSQFVDNLYSGYRNLVPEWFKESLVWKRKGV